MHRDDDTPLSDQELAEAKRGEALISAAVAKTQAPQSLRESIERQRARPPKRAFWRRPWTVAAMATSLAVLAGVVIAIQAGNDKGGPSVAAVEAVAQQNATDPAPAPNGGDPPVLAARVGPIPFPDWQQSFGWKAVGAREDEIAGRTVKTVFYRNPKGANLAYSIVAGQPLTEPRPGRPVTRTGNTYRVAHLPGHTLVTWTQQGHTCALLASASVPPARVVTLAASRNT
jgi:hypothetical protein